MVQFQEAESVAALLGRIGCAQKAAPLAAARVMLVGASKTVPSQLLSYFIAAGMTHFAENRVQEAAQKWPPLREAHPEIRLHLIGPLQTNKVKEALALFDIIETLDRERLVDAIAGEMKSGAARTREYFIQINTGEEPQKGGVAPLQADALIAYAKSKGLNVTGLMCIPPADENPAPHFALLRAIAERNGLRELSMGMSNDFETAIRFGATQVRIGTALFGRRETI